MRARHLPIIVALTLLLSACAQQPAPPAELPTPIALITGSHETPTEIRPTETPTQAPTFELPAQPENRTTYDLDLSLDYAQHTASVVQKITYFNRTDQPMQELLLLIPPRYFAGVYSQGSLSGNLVMQSRESGIRTMLSLEPALQPGESTTIQVIFTLLLPKRPGVFGWSEMQTNLMDWFPIIPPFDPVSGWLANERVVDVSNTIVGEYLSSETADFSLRLRLTGSAQNLIIAASSEGVEKDGIFEYRLPLARSFSLSVSDQFITREADHKGVSIRTYVFPQHREAGETIIEVAKNALDLYAELFYPYPRKTLSLVSADFLHNMETDGMLLISKGVIDFYRDAPLNNLTILVPHEISHQWFYSLVGNDPAKEPWLDETIATYCESLYFERYHPEHLAWWWSNRVDGFKPEGWVNATIYIPGGYSAYRDAVYLNGAKFMQELRNLTGDDAFFAALQQYTLQNTYKIASESDFFKALRNHSSADLNPLLQKYFENPPAY